MTRIVLDTALRSKLQELTQPVELCDESGRVLGRYTPMVDLSQCGPLEPQINAEELARRKRSSEQRHTTAEVLAHLGRL